MFDARTMQNFDVGVEDQSLSLTLFTIFRNLLYFRFSYLSLRYDLYYIHFHL